MTARRISRPTPYILSTAEVEEVLKHLPQRVELATAALMNLTLDDWRKQSSKMKVKQLIDHQNAGAFAAAMAVAEKAIGDLETVAHPGIQGTVDLEELIPALVDELHKRGMIMVNPNSLKEV